MIDIISTLIVLEYGHKIFRLIAFALKLANNPIKFNFREKKK